MPEVQEHVLCADDQSAADDRDDHRDNDQLALSRTLPPHRSAREFEQVGHRMPAQGIAHDPRIVFAQVPARHVGRVVGAAAGAHTGWPRLDARGSDEVAALLTQLDFGGARLVRTQSLVEAFDVLLDAEAIPVVIEAQVQPPRPDGVLTFKTPPTVHDPVQVRHEDEVGRGLVIG